MKFGRVFAAVVALAVISAVCVGQEQTYQPGKIVSIQKHEARTAGGGSDAQLKADLAVYDVSIETNGKVYLCLYRTAGDLDPSWAQGKEGEVRVKGKTMYLKKANGQEEKLSIVSSKPANK